ncbi:hypothetical protein [Pseudoalteromonas mariniglutinosa]|uniref:hypothetical protein n=1 Tax=Pseudoalteromonas mariniglutinosa TaxID=206042 RepID=UPI00384FB40A
MNEHARIGFALINKAPYGICVAVAVAFVAGFFFHDLAIVNFYYASIGGMLCALFLLAYWSGKGGLFFIAAVFTPLLLVMVSPLATLASLLYLLSGFFAGFWLLLLIYKVIKAKPSGRD